MIRAGLIVVMNNWMVEKSIGKLFLLYEMRCSLLNNVIIVVNREFTTENTAGSSKLSTDSLDLETPWIFLMEGVVLETVW
jgi:hypothetical protein